MLRLLLVLATACLASSAPVQDHALVNCPTLLTAAGASPDYAGNVAHTIHSITMTTIRRLKGDVSADNGVPTVNLDLASKDAILANAPDGKAPDDDKFLTEGMRVLNGVLSHLGQENWDVNGFTPVERIAHAFHMLELWTATEAEYRRLEANAPSASVCACASNLEETEILRAMRILAIQIREPALVYGAPQGKVGGYNVAYNVHYVYHFKYPELKNALAKRNGTQALYPSEVLQEPSASQSLLRTAEDWAVWKKAGMLLADMPDGKEIPRDAALFLFCTLNKAQ